MDKIRKATLTRKLNIHTIEIGSYVGDLHDGHPDYEYMFGCRVTVDRVELSVSGGSDIIDRILRTQLDEGKGHLKKRYTNKGIVLVSRSDMWGTLGFMYSYDDDKLGVVTVFPQEG